MLFLYNLHQVCTQFLHIPQHTLYAKLIPPQKKVLKPGNVDNDRTCSYHGELENDEGQGFLRGNVS